MNNNNQPKIQKIYIMVLTKIYVFLRVLFYLEMHGERKLKSNF